MKSSPLVRLPRMTSVCLLTLTSEMPPSFTCSRNWEYGMSCTAFDRALKLLTTVATTTAITIHRTMFLARSFKVAYVEGGCGSKSRPYGPGGVSSRHYYNPVRHCHNRVPALVNGYQESGHGGLRGRAHPELKVRASR